MTSAYFWSFLTPPPPHVSVCQNLNTPLNNDVRPEHTPPLLRTNFTKFLSKKVGASRYLPNAHFGTIKNHFGPNKFKGWVFLFIYLLQLQQNIFFFADIIIGLIPPPPMSGFVSISLTPPPPLGC